MNLNPFTVIGFIGNNYETKYLSNGPPVTRFSVATKFRGLRKASAKA